MPKPCIYRNVRTLSAKDLAGELRVLEKLKVELGHDLYKKHKPEFYRLVALRGEVNRRKIVGVD